MSQLGPYGVQNKIIGTKQHDLLLGSGKNDFIDGKKGNDRIVGKGKNDYLVGGNGNDSINGDSGNDEIYGGKNNDFIEGGKGNDYLRGGTGDDIQYGGKGNDILLGDKGNDIQYGGESSDTIFGDKGNDLIYGGDGNDRITGGQGKNTIDGGEGKDTVVYDKNMSKYNININGNIVSVNTGNSSDYLENVEFIQFKDQLLPVVGGKPPFNGYGTPSLPPAGGVGYGTPDLPPVGGGGGGSGYGTPDSPPVGGGGGGSGYGTPDTPPVGGGGGGGAGYGSPSPEPAPSPGGGGYGSKKLLSGSAQDDRIVSKESDTKVVGKFGNDFLLSASALSIFKGGKGDDFLASKIKRTSTLDGGKGNDIMLSSFGSDYLKGGKGQDTFILTGSGLDIITDFNPAEGDILILENENFNIQEFKDAFFIEFKRGKQKVVVQGSTNLDELRSSIFINSASISTGKFLIGSAEDDSLSSGSADGLLLYGGDGSDTLTSFIGTDSLAGGAGSDHFIINGDSAIILDFNIFDGDYISFGNHDLKASISEVRLIGEDFEVLGPDGNRVLLKGLNSSKVKFDDIMNYLL